MTREFSELWREKGFIIRTWYEPPKPKPAPEPLRQECLGEWLSGGSIITSVGAAFEDGGDEDGEGEDNDEHAEFSNGDDDDTPTSYRRPRTPLPPPLYKCRKKGKADHATSTPVTSWRARQCDSDFEPPSPGSLAADDENPYIFAPPDDVLPALHRRRLQHYSTPLDKASNPGQALFHLRRDAWTSASLATGLIPVCTSRSADNPLTRLVVPEAYPQIYKKVVADGAVPPVPIALDKMVTAIVDGWKRSDFWGRKPPSVEPSMRARTRGPTGKERERQWEWAMGKGKGKGKGKVVRKLFVDDLMESQTFYASAKKKKRKIVIALVKPPLHLILSMHPVYSAPLCPRH